MSKRSRHNAESELVLALGLLVRRLRSESLSERPELSWTQMSVLSRLAKEGPATTADLARAESVKPQSMGTIIAALEKMGLVARKPHQTDGRQIYIELSAKGASMRESVKDAKRLWLAGSIAQLDKRDQETLFAAAEVIKRLAEM